MSGWAAKRFWDNATVELAGHAFEVRLDGRPVRTPLKAPLHVPTAKMAEAIAVEWQAQTGLVDPRTMPVTRSANAAIDKVAPQHEGVCQMLASYGETDLLCYRAPGPDTLMARQSQAWDPLLDWAADRFTAPLVTTQGVIPIAQYQASIAILHHAVSSYRPFSLTAVHDLITLSGSLILGLAVAEQWISADSGWNLSRIDEDWQVEQWGADDEAAEMAITKRDAFLHAAAFLDLSNQA